MRSVTPQSTKDLVIGAGISGLTLGWSLESESLAILEKSKALGGRMATRRVGEYTFDHGAQFFREGIFPELEALWTAKDASTEWFRKGRDRLMCGKGGMTALAKVFEERVFREQLVERIEKTEDRWEVTTEKGDVFLSQRVFLTCPLPQSLKILTNSNLPFPPELNSMLYDKALVGLFGLDPLCKLPTGFDYVDSPSVDVRMIANQYSKRVSPNPAITVVMSAEWSEQNFDQDETRTLLMIQKEFEDHLAAKGLGARIQNASLKKWRYAFPSKSTACPYLEVMPRLFLLGDAFGDGSLAGAVASANALAAQLRSRLD